MKRNIPSTRTGRQRLLKAAALLEADAKNKNGIKFDFGCIGYVADRSKPLSCGTVGCALGLFGVSGAFEKQGLRCHIGRRVGTISLSFRGTRDTFRAAAKLFQITGDEAEYLFSSQDGLDEDVGGKAERAIAKRIRKFVAGKQRIPSEVSVWI